MGQKVLGILQARMTSNRLPGKVLLDVGGKPMILQQLERIKAAREITDIVVATSSDVSDDPLVEVLEKEKVQYFRGSLLNVASRFLDVIREQDSPTVVRLTADCPLTDPDVIDLVIVQHHDYQADYTSNTLRRTFPKGLDVEVFEVPAFENLLQSSLDAFEKEHVTPGFYNGKRNFKLHSVEQEFDHSGARWTVDYPEDLEFVRNVYDALADFRGIFRASDVAKLGLKNTRE